MPIFGAFCEENKSKITFNVDDEDERSKAELLKAEIDSSDMECGSHIIKIIMKPDDIATYYYFDEYETYTVQEQGLNTTIVEYVE